MTMTRKKHTVLLQLAPCWPRPSRVERLEPWTSRYTHGAPCVTELVRCSSCHSFILGLIVKAGLLQGIPELKKGDRQKFYKAFGISAEEAEGHEASLAAAAKGVAEPANKRRRTAIVKASHCLFCPCIKPATSVVCIHEGVLDSVGEAAAFNCLAGTWSGNGCQDYVCAQEEPDADEPPAAVKEEVPADADAELDSVGVKDEEGDDETEAAADEENEDPLAGIFKHAAATA